MLKIQFSYNAFDDYFNPSLPSLSPVVTATAFEDQVLLTGQLNLYKQQKVLIYQDMSSKDTMYINYQVLLRLEVKQ